MDTILITGATGYIGGRLVPRLLAEGRRLRLLVRDPLRLEGRPWLNQVEVACGDVLDPLSLRPAMEGISQAYYLIHGMQAGRVIAARETQAAANFAQEAGRAGLRHIIYLGELADPAGGLSPYLDARRRAGEILRRGRTPVTEFRAGMVIGAGSVLFEMVRYIAERQPAFICPRWWFTCAQPIAISDVLAYLAAALQTPPAASRVIEIGGASRLTYADMLGGYARLRGLKRLLIPTPFHAPRLSAYWVHMITPIQWQVVAPLIAGLRTESLVTSDDSARFFPQITPMDYETAVRQALGRLESDDVETSWMDSLVVSQGDQRPVTLTTREGMLIESRRLHLSLPAGTVFRAYTGLGGECGWLYLDWSWRLRGWADKLLGGVGLRRGRRHPDELRPGEALDFWRVEAVEPERMLRLRAEMKLPGKAWLEFQSLPQENGSTLLVQNAYFAPRGLLGFLYWYALMPIHPFIFSGMIRRIGQRAQQIADEQD